MPTPDLNMSYQLLGLTPRASIGEVERAYKKLASRCDPARFVANSDEKRTSNLIRKRLDVAYQQLRSALS